MFLSTESFPVDFISHSEGKGAEGWVKANVHYVVIAPDQEIPSRGALVVIGLEGHVLFERIISDLWEAEDRGTALNIGISCIADYDHPHWYSFHFADAETLQKFRVKYDEALDLVEAHRIRQQTRLEDATDAVLRKQATRTEQE